MKSKMVFFLEESPFMAALKEGGENNIEVGDWRRWQFSDKIVA
jgi:hypothetical protein